MIEAYYALGDGLSMDPLIAESPMPPGPASILASELARNHGCQRFKNLACERAPLSTTWRNGIHPILPSKGETIVTLTVGLEDLVIMGHDHYTDALNYGIHELVTSYRRLVRAIKRLLPGALIIGTTVPDPTLGVGYFPNHRLSRFPSFAVPLFNEQLIEYATAYASDGPGFVVADVTEHLAEPEAWSDQDNLQLSRYGAQVIATTWMGEIRKAEMVGMAVI
jgi:hypothetical protein